LLIGDDGVVWAGEVEDDREDFPPERDRGLGGGGFIRVDEDLEREPCVETDSTVAFVRSSTPVPPCTRSSVGFAPSRMGSDTDRRLPEDIFELLLLSTAAMIGGCGT